MTDSVLARLAALKTAPMPMLKQQWRDLFDREPPPYNRSAAGDVICQRACLGDRDDPRGFLSPL